MREKALNHVTLVFGLIITLFISAFSGTYAFAESAPHTVHITYTGIESSIINGHINPDYDLADDDMYTEDDSIPSLWIRNYYGDNGLSKDHPIEKIVINGKDFTVPESADSPVTITELEGIDFDGDGFITISRANNDLKVAFGGEIKGAFETRVVQVYLMDDLTIDVVFSASHTHSLDKVAEISATCTEPGTEAYWKCADPECGKMFSDEAGTIEITEPVAIPAKGHSLQKIEASSATYTAAGNSEYYVCTECGKYFSDAEGKNEIAQDSWVIAKLAKKAQPMKVSAKKVSVKYKKIKKKAKTAAALSVSGAQGKVSYKIQKISTKKKLAKQAKKKIKLATNGKLKLKKGLKKGTYKVSVQVAAAETAEYAAAEKTVTVKVVVK